MCMKLGLCLTGGGAKGAFQGGVIKGLYENNIIPDILTGTSIGAMNLYFMIKGCYDEIDLFWNNIENSGEYVKPGWVIDNSLITNELSKLSGQEDRIKAAFVNYVHVKNNKMSEVIVNLKSLSIEDAQNAIKYSSLLPSRPIEYRLQAKTNITFDSRSIFNNFKEDMEKGVYEGYNLDGGILNNSLLTPLIEERVDKLLIIGLHDNYTPPEYIYDNYQKKDVIILRPDIRIHPMDTLRFEKDFCKDLFNRGYKLSIENVNKLLK